MTIIAETLTELERAGFTAGDRMRLLIRFEAPTLRAATELAASVRMGRHNQVQVRPDPRRLLSSRRWTVIVTTPPAPVMRAVIELWFEQMQEVVEHHAGCAIVGLEPNVMRIPAL